MIDQNRSEAQRRVDAACFKIESAYRLAELDVDETMNAVATAIVYGAKAAADDVEERVMRWSPR